MDESYRYCTAQNNPNMIAPFSNIYLKLKNVQNESILEEIRIVVALEQRI